MSTKINCCRDRIIKNTQRKCVDDCPITSEEYNCDRECAIPLCYLRTFADDQIECEAEAICAKYIGCEKINFDVHPVCPKYSCGEPTTPKSPTETDVSCRVNIIIPTKHCSTKQAFTSKRSGCTSCQM